MRDGDIEASPAPIRDTVNAHNSFRKLSRMIWSALLKALNTHTNTPRPYMNILFYFTDFSLFLCITLGREPIPAPIFPIFCKRIFPQGTTRGTRENPDRANLLYTAAASFHLPQLDIAQTKCSNVELKQQHYARETSLQSERPLNQEFRKTDGPVYIVQQLFS